MRCDNNESKNSKQLLVGNWICDSVKTENSTYNPLQNPLLFYEKKKLKIISYNTSGDLLVNNRKFATFTLHDRQIKIIQLEFKDTISKKIILINKEKLILEEQAAIFANVVYRGASSQGKTIKLFYSKIN